MIEEKISLIKVFSRNVFYYRKQCNLTQEQLAEKIDVATNTIWKIENAKEFPKAEIIDALADELNVSPCQFFIRETDELVSKKQVMEIQSNMMQFLSMSVRDLIDPDPNIKYGIVNRSTKNKPKGDGKSWTF